MKPCRYSCNIKQVFTDNANFFLISTGEESSQPTKNAKKIGINIFDYEGHDP